MAEGALREIIAAFGVQVDDKALKGLETKIDDTKKALLGIGAALGGKALVEGLAHFIEGQIELGDNLVDMADRLGVGVKELQAFQYAAGLVGVSSDDAAKSLKFLNLNMGKALQGESDPAATFAALGVAIRDSGGTARESLDVLADVADAFQGMGSQQERTAYATKIFGKAGASMLPILKNGAKGVREVYAEFEELGGGLDGDFLEAADKVGDNIFRMKTALAGLKSVLAGTVIPAVDAIVRRVTRWIVYFRHLIKNTEVLRAGLLVLATVIGGVLLSNVNKLSKALTGGSTSAWDVGKAFLSWGPAGLAIAGIAAALAAIFLISEDLMVGLKGGKSAIKAWLDEAVGVEESDRLFKELKTTIETIQGIVTKMAPEFAKFGVTILMAMGKAAPAIMQVAIAVSKLLLLLTGAATALAQLLTGNFSGAGKTIDMVGDAVAKDGFKRFLGGKGEGDVTLASGRVVSRNEFDALQALEAQRKAAPRAQILPGAAPAGGFTPAGFQPGPWADGMAPVNQTNQTTITINGATDPKAVGAEVHGAMERLAAEQSAALAAMPGSQR